MVVPWASTATAGAAAAFSSDANRRHRLLIVGLGRVGTHVAEQAMDSQQFERIVGTVRRNKAGSSVVVDSEVLPGIEPPGFASGEKEGRIETCWFDEMSSTLVESSTHILFAMPAPDPAASAVIENVILPALRLTSPDEHREGRPGRWIGIVSTTGVYGDHDGQYVTEESDCRCDPDTSAGRLLEFENRWKRFVQGGDSDAEEIATRVRVRVFRSAGIYGTTRSALHTVFRNGVEPVPPSSLADASTLRRSDDVTNRIHEADLGAAILSSMLLNESNDPLPRFRVYNVADDLPESRRTVLEHAARLLRDEGVDVSETRTASRQEPSVGRSRRRTEERKLVSNDRLKDELLPTLTYPTYKEGLAQILRHSDAPWRPSNAKTSNANAH